MASRLLGTAMILISGASVLLGQVGTPQRVRVSEGVMRGMLIKKVAPQAPGDAAHIEGVVVLRATIDKKGNVENLETTSGHPLLVPAAINAVKDWKYKPFLLNGELVEVETTIHVSFISSMKTSPTGITGDVSGGAAPDQVGSVASPSQKPRPLIPIPQRVRVSQGVEAGLLLERVDPLYPPDAKAQHVEGAVLLRVMINEQGQVENVVLITGHPTLAPAAIDAVKKWKYRPYMLNGEPVAVDTQVEVTFSRAK